MDSLVTIIVDLAKKLAKHLGDAARTLLKAIEHEVEAALQKVLNALVHELDLVLRSCV